MSRREKSALAEALEDSRRAPREWLRMSGTFPYATAISHVERIRSINGHRTERLPGLAIERGEAWDARVVVPPGGALDDCAVWVMYRGESD